jgi:hypothetical protein
MSDNDTVNEIWPGFLARQPHHPLASQCLLSLSQVYFGLQQNVHTVVTIGMTLYGRSLLQLNAVLNDTVVRRHDDALLSTMILFLYEMLVLSSTDGWIEHALGLGRLIELRGAESFDDTSNRILFESNRFIVILASLITSKPTFLSQNEWKNLPWRTEPENKNDMHFLLDLLADLATLKALQANTCTDVLDPTLRRSLSDVIEDLQLWRASWDAVNTERVILSPSHCDDSDVLPHVLWFSSLHKANVFGLYNATYIQGLRLLSNANGGQLSTEEAQDLHAAGLEICQATDFQLNASDPMAGQFLVLFPLQMAALALEHSQSPLKDWVATKLSSFAAAQTSWGVARQLSAYTGRADRSITVS